MKLDQDKVGGQDNFLADIEKFKLLTKLLPIAIYSTDKFGVINYYNEAAAKLWGHRPRLNDPTEVKYCGSWKIFDTNGYLLPHEDSPMAKALQDGKVRRNDEMVIVRPDYSKVDVLVHIDPIFDARNEINGAINVLLDITNRKQIEKDVYHLAAIVESSEDAIISKTLSGDITSWNKGAERVFGFTSEEAIGKNITMFIPPERIDEEVVIINKIRSGQKVDHFETVRLNKEGKYINVSLTVSPIKNSQGQIIGASKVARNIDEQVEIRKKLKEYNRELKRLNTYKDEFISLASHELKTPLTVVKAHLELLSDTASEENIEFFNKTQVHINKLTYLINEMLDISKIEDKQMKLDYSTFNFDTMLKECIESVEVVNNGSLIKYENDFPDLVIEADQQRLEQVITNLMNNAVKYSPSSKVVKLKVLNHEQEVEVHVIDRGMGIPPNEQENIFNRFYRMDGLSKHIAGLGIGLYISRQIIERHNGKIWVEHSEPDKGSTFAFKIPKKRPKPKAKKLSED